MSIGVDKNYNPVLGSAAIAGGTYLGYKGLMSGLRRAMGIRIEEHTTTLKNAMSIIKDGCILKPSFGGTSASSVFMPYKSCSANFVHITGVHPSVLSALDPNLINGLPIVRKVCENDILRSLYRKGQRLMYRASSVLDFSSANGSDVVQNFVKIAENNFKTKTQTAKSIFDICFSNKAKTFYVGGTDKYFATNFVPDVSDLALKTDKCVKVSTSKFGAMVDALKRDGLSGMFQNKVRLIGGILIAGVLGYLAYRCIKYGIGKFKKQEDIKDTLAEKTISNTSDPISATPSEITKKQDKKEKKGLIVTIKDENEK